jgi:predicted dehydrogenase
MSGTGGDVNAQTMDKCAPLKVALLGAGLFATNSHAPTLTRYPELFEVTCVWSRKLVSSQGLAAKFGQDCDAYGGDDGLEQLFVNHPDVEAVIMALPLDVQPAYILKCLKDYKKHVLSEKPIAATVSEGKALLEQYQDLSSEPYLHWSVAENFRYEPGIRYMAEEVVQSGVIG